MVVLDIKLKDRLESSRASVKFKLKMSDEFRVLSEKLLFSYSLRHERDARASCEILSKKLRGWLERASVKFKSIMRKGD